MNVFFWADGRLGWGFFSLLVFTGLCCLVADLLWRARNIRFTRFLGMAIAAWATGSVLIVFGSWLVNA
jgi:hypothetical protein